MNQAKHIFVPVVLAISMTGCAVPGSSPTYTGGAPVQSYPVQGQGNQLGYVDRIEVVNRSGGTNATGTIVGGIIGGLIGTQIGRGTGRTAATVAGAVGGAVAGNAIEGRRRAANETFRVTVRLDSGAMQAITQDNITDLRTGDRVRVDGNVISRV